MLPHWSPPSGRPAPRHLTVTRAAQRSPNRRRRGPAPTGRRRTRPDAQADGGCGPAPRRTAAVARRPQADSGRDPAPTGGRRPWPGTHRRTARRAWCFAGGRPREAPRGITAYARVAEREARRSQDGPPSEAPPPELVITGGVPPQGLMRWQSGARAARRSDAVAPPEQPRRPTGGEPDARERAAAHPHACGQPAARGTARDHRLRTGRRARGPTLAGRAAE